MRARILIVSIFLVLALGGKAYSQPSVPEAKVMDSEGTVGLLSRKGERLYLDGSLLNDYERVLLLSDVGGRDLAKKWDTSCAFKMGGRISVFTGCALEAGMLITAGACAAVSVADFMTAIALVFGTLDSSEETKAELADEYNTKLGPANKFATNVLAPAMEIFLISGAVALIGGAASWIYGSVGMSNVVKTFNNESRKMTLTFGPTVSGGVGLALNF